MCGKATEGEKKGPFLRAHAKFRLLAAAALPAYGTENIHISSFPTLYDLIAAG